MVPSLNVARRRGGSARVTRTWVGRLNLPFVLGSWPGTLRGSGAQTEVSLGPGTGPRPAAKKQYDHRPASAHILTRRTAKRSPHRRRVSLPRLRRPRSFHDFGVGRHRTMTVWGGAWEAPRRSSSASLCRQGARGGLEGACAVCLGAGEAGLGGDDAQQGRPEVLDPAALRVGFGCGGGWRSAEPGRVTTRDPCRLSQSNGGSRRARALCRGFRVRVRRRRLVQASEWLHGPARQRARRGRARRPSQRAAWWCRGPGASACRAGSFVGARVRESELLGPDHGAVLRRHCPRHLVGAVRVVRAGAEAVVAR